MIGKVVDGTLGVTVSGKTLEKEAIVIEGTSYIPLKLAGQAFGYTVAYNHEAQRVDLTKPVTMSEKDRQIRYTQSAISLIQKRISEYEAKLASDPDSMDAPAIKKLIEDEKAALAEQEKKLAELTAQ